MLNATTVLTYLEPDASGAVSTTTAGITFEKLTNTANSANFVAASGSEVLPRHSLGFKNKEGAASKATFGTNRCEMNMHLMTSVPTPEGGTAVVPTTYKAVHSRPVGLTIQEQRRQLEIFRAYVASPEFVDAFINLEV